MHISHEIDSLQALVWAIVFSRTNIIWSGVIIDEQTINRVFSQSAHFKPIGLFASTVFSLFRSIGQITGLLSHNGLLIIRHYCLLLGGTFTEQSPNFSPLCLFHWDQCSPNGKQQICMTKKQTTTRTNNVKNSMLAIHWHFSGDTKYYVIYHQYLYSQRTFKHK